jgi:hypothetical protein
MARKRQSDSTEDEESAGVPSGLPWYLRKRTTDFVSWEELCELPHIPDHHLTLCLFIEAIRRACERYLPNAIKTFKRRSAEPLSPEQEDVAIHARAMANKLSNFRISNRSALKASMPMREARYENEPLSMCIHLWIIECQCRTLAYYLSNNGTDTRTSDAFPVLNAHLNVKTMGNIPVMKYPVSRLRMALLRVMGQWKNIPILDPEFIQYMQVLRIRASQLQVLGFARTTLDVPKWAKAVGTDPVKNREVCRASFLMAATFELMFYHLDRFILHTKQMSENARPISEDMCSPLDIAYFRRWLDERVDSVFLDEFRRRVCTQCVENEVFPHEEELYKLEDPTASTDTRTVFKYFKMTEFEEIQKLYLVKTNRELITAQPVVAAVYVLIFLMQGIVNSFKFEDYIKWPRDVRRVTIGQEYPDILYFKQFEHPVMYFPMTGARFWMISNGQVYDCGSDYHKAMAAWLRTALGLCSSQNTDQMYSHGMSVRFQQLRKYMRPGTEYVPPVLYPSTIKRIEEQPPEYTSMEEDCAEEGEEEDNSMQAQLARELSRFAQRDEPAQIFEV